jgi:hypothetical protein
MLVRRLVLLFAGLAACATTPLPTSKTDGYAAATPAELAAPCDDPNAPEQLDKRAIVEGMSKVKPAVGDCFDRYQQPGAANVEFTILRSGRPANVAIRGDFAGMPVGACVASAVASKASFPRYCGELKTLSYPFILR